MEGFNLIDEPWIPCIDMNGRTVEYGIRDTLLQAHLLREIFDDSPLVTVSIHRLLLAILFRAFEGPKDFESWKKLWEGKSFKRSNLTDYIEKWESRFDLFSQTHPFYQMKGLETRKAVTVTRLATECSSGNNTTLFDHSTDMDRVFWAPPQTAKWLIACQSFALGFGKSRNATIKGKEEKIPYSADGIALRGMCVWLQGENLFDTLMINLIPNDNESLPPWELEDPHVYRDKLDGKKRKTYSSFGLVDRLTWQSRLILLLPEHGTVSNMYFTQGRSADKSPGDPMKVYRASINEGISPLSFSSTKATWREAHSIMMIPLPNSNEHRPECFNLVARIRLSGILEQQKHYLINVAGLASAPGKAGKFLLWRQERMPIPASILINGEQIERIGNLLRNSELTAGELRKRVYRIAKLYIAPDSEVPGSKQPDSNEVIKISDAINPCHAYWSRLEEHFFPLLREIAGDWDKEKNEWKPDGEQLATIAWRKALKKEAQRALEESIRALGTTGRAIQAVARVRTNFYDWNPESSFNHDTNIEGKEVEGNES